MVNKLNNFIKKYNYSLLWLSIFIYIALFIYLSYKKYYGFSYNGLDLAIFNQVFNNILQGNYLAPTLNLNTYLADHFTPIVFLLVPFYWLKPSPQILLIMQAIIIALSAWPLYKITTQINVNKNIALSVALLWLCNPLVHNANLFEFHLLPWAIFFIFWTFYFYQKNDFIKFVIFFSLALLVREDVSFILLGFLPLSYLDRKTIKWRLFSLLLPLFYFFLALKIVAHFNSDDSYKFLVYYGWLGGTSLLSVGWSFISHPIEVFWHVFKLSNIFSIAVILLPVLFLPLLRSKYLWLAALPLLQFILSGAGLNPVVYHIHYGLLFMPAIFIALIFALDRINRRAKFWHSHLVYEHYGFTKLVLLVAVIYFIVFLSPVQNIIAKNYDGSVHGAEREFIAGLLPTDSLAAELKYLPTLSNQHNILYPLHYAYLGHGQFSKDEFVLPPVDYIMADYNEFISNLTDIATSPLKQKYGNNLPAQWRNLLANYTLIEAHNSFLVWQDKTKTEQDNILLYEINAKEPNSYYADFLVDSEYFSADKKTLKLTLQKAHTENNNYLVRFYTEDSYFDIPLDYGLLPEREWADNELVSFYYYLDNQVSSWQIFKWQGNNKIGPLREIAVDLELWPETTRNNLF